MGKKVLPDIVIIGAGITGMATALYLARRGYMVRLYEARSNGGQSTAQATISLDLSERGLFALSEIGINLKGCMVPLFASIFRYCGRDIAVKYGRRPEECIYSIARHVLYYELLSSVSNKPAIQLFTEHRLADIDSDRRELTFLTPQGTVKTKYQIVIGCDGIHSKVREVISKYTVPANREDSGIRYTEFRLPVRKRDGLEMYSSCFWPELDHALVTHPIHAENALSCTLIGRKEFDVTVAFQHNKLPFDLRNAPQPKAVLQSVFAKNWSAHGNLLIMGDAAHAMLPFLGQGVNCCLEDCTELNTCLDICQDTWDTAIPMFEKNRRPNAKAILAMSAGRISDFFYSSRRQLASDFQAKMRVHELTEAIGIIPFAYFLRFTRIPYSEIYELKKQQEAVMRRIHRSGFDIHEQKTALAIRGFKAYQQGWLAKNGWRDWQ